MVSPSSDNPFNGLFLSVEWYRSENPDFLPWIVHADITQDVFFIRASALPLPSNQEAGNFKRAWKKPIRTLRGGQTLDEFKELG